MQLIIVTLIVQKKQDCTLLCHAFIRNIAMCFHMPVQIVSPRISLHTNITPKRLIRRMNNHVLLQVRIRHKRTLAQHTRKILLPHVPLHVHDQTARL